MARAFAAFERFTAATGKDAAAAFDEFEAWLKDNPAPPASADEGSAS